MELFYNESHVITEISSMIGIGTGRIALYTTSHIMTCTHRKILKPQHSAQALYVNALYTASPMDSSQHRAHPSGFP